MWVNLRWLSRIRARFCAFWLELAYPADSAVGRLLAFESLMSEIVEADANM